MLHTRLHTYILIGAIPVLALITPGCSEGPEQSGFQMPPMPVEASTVVRETVTEQFSSLGSLDAINSIEVVTEVDGRVMALPFTEGMAIQRGELIAQLDDEELRSVRDRAEAVLEQRRVTFERVQKIVEQGAGSKQDLDDASAAYKVAEAELALANARLSKMHITAPFSGIVGAKRVSIGEFLQSGDAITQLAQIEELKISFSAPERYYRLLYKGAPISVSSPALGGEVLKGRIDVIEPIIDPRTRNVNLVAHLDNSRRLFRPGMSGDVTAILSERDSALVIPSEAVFAEGDQLFVFVIGSDGSVAKAPISLGSRMAGTVEVVAGLSDGQQIVRTGHQKLFPGAKVMTGPPPGAQEGQPVAAGTGPAEGSAALQSDTTGGTQ